MAHADDCTPGRTRVAIAGEYTLACGPMLDDHFLVVILWSGELLHYPAARFHVIVPTIEQLLGRQMEWRLLDRAASRRLNAPAQRVSEGDVQDTDDPEVESLNLKSIPGGVDGVVIITRPEITDRLVRDCAEAKVPRVWMHQSLGNGPSVSPAAVDFCRQHGIGVIAGARPMMFGPGVDFGHTCCGGS